MPSKQPPAKSSASAASTESAETESSSTSPLSHQTSLSPQVPVPPATKRFTIAVLLFGAWLVFLTYLAFLTWSGK
ncbi:hypothetical protein N9Y42_09380 [Mariniblastus sp.]|nr:hypothetical protein [Mariniblastus sp.]